MRLNKYLAQCGVASRREADRMIAAGRIRIGEDVIEEMGYQVQEGDTVYLDDKLVEPATETIVIAINKPLDVLVTRSDPHGRNTVYDILPEKYKALHYVGRLDYNSHGLLLMTNNGELSRRLTLPMYEIEREYLVKTVWKLNETSLERLQQGLVSEDGTEYQPCFAEFMGGGVRMVLTEGKKREIREMMKILKYTVKDLLRLSYAGFSLENLGWIEEGKFVEFTEEQVKALSKKVQL